MRTHVTAAACHLTHGYLHVTHQGVTKAASRPETLYKVLRPYKVLRHEGMHEVMPANEVKVQHVWKAAAACAGVHAVKQF